MTAVYLYGMVLSTNSFLLKGDFPQAESYNELRQRFRLPGGETGTAATVLSSLGVSVKMDGTHLGYNVYPIIEDFYKDKNVDISSMFFDKDYIGLEDFVIIDKTTRTVFGTFQEFYSSGRKQWSKPKESDIANVKVAAVDPYFGDESLDAAKLCVKHNIPFVTIDCNPDTYFHQHAAINIISGEHIRNAFPEGTTREELFPKYAQESDGLTIITNGGKPFYYGRKNSPMKTFTPFKVDVTSTLGAGDTFKAACTYALLKGMNDDDTVAFASACSAIAITRFPLPLNPPKLDEVEKLVNSRK